MTDKCALPSLLLKQCCLCCFVEYSKWRRNQTCIMAGCLLVKRKRKRTESTDLTATIKKLRSQLSNIIEPDFGLLNQLLSLDVLTRRQLADVRSRKTVYERSDAVLGLLETKAECNKFLKALQRTGQQHVLNFIMAHGGQNINLSVKYPMLSQWHIWKFFAKVICASVTCLIKKSHRRSGLAFLPSVGAVP